MPRNRHVRRAAGFFFALLLNGLLLAQQGKIFIGKVTQVTATQVTAVENGQPKKFSLSKNTKQVPRTVQAGDSVRITYLDADVPVVVQVEVIPPSQ
jgi:hypothetical protein